MQLWIQVWDSTYHFYDSVSFFNNFSVVIMRMLDQRYFRALDILKGLLRLAMLPKGKRLDHNWGDIFLFRTFFLMRVYLCPQAPHILPKFIDPPRLGIIEFIWKLFILKREYLGPKVHRGTFLCRCFRIGDFTIGKDETDMVYVDEFIIARDSYHGWEYDYVEYILEVMKENIS